MKCMTSSTATSASTSIDQNRDGQLTLLLRLDAKLEQIAKLRSIRHYDGLPIDARSITDELLKQEAL